MCKQQVNEFTLKKILLLILVLCNISTSQAIAESLNFNDFLTAVLHNSYNLKISKIEQSIANKSIKEAQSGYYPTINAFITGERYNNLAGGNTQITAIGNEILLNRSYFQDMASLGLSYNIFNSGTRSRQLDIAKADNLQKELLLQKNTRNLKIVAIDLYGETLNLYKILQIKSEILTLQDELIDINKRLREAGELSAVDLLDQKIEASETKSELEEIKNNLAKKLSEVSFYTNNDYYLEDLIIEDFSKEIANANISEEDIKSSAQMFSFSPEKSFEAQAADLEILKKKKEYEIQKRINYPKIRFDTRYNFYGSDPNNFFRGIEDISQRSLTIRLSASMIFFDGFKNLNTIAKKKLEIKKAKIDKERLIAELKKEYEQIQQDSHYAIIQAENNATNTFNNASIHCR